MQPTNRNNRSLTIFSLASGLLGLLCWLAINLSDRLFFGGEMMALVRTGQGVALLAGLSAIGLSVLALRHLEPCTLLHRRATEGFVFGVILLAFAAVLPVSY